jgi:hypothetical protein
MISIMTLLPTVEESGVHFIWCCILSGWGSLNTMILSIQSLKEIGARNHLLPRGDKSLASQLRNLSRTLWDGAEDRSSRQRIDVDTGPRVGALLGLTLLLVLACQHSSPILEHKNHVYHGVLEVTCFQSIGKSIIQTIEESLLLLLVSNHVIWSIAEKLRETSDILAHHYGSLLQILELLLELDNTLRYMMRSESHLELIPVDGVGFFMSFYICIPPISYKSCQLVRS